MSLALVAVLVGGGVPRTPALAVVHAEDVVPPPPPPPRPAISGFIDTHLHQFSNLGFGGVEVWGSPVDPLLVPAAWLNVATRDEARRRALPDSDFTYLSSAEVADYLGAGGVPVVATPSATACDNGNCWPQCPAGTGVAGNACWRVEIHGPGGSKDLLNKFIGSGDHGTFGYPFMVGWPASNVVTTQQVYWEWLERAYDHGLRLMVMLAVNNSVLCQLGIHRASFGCGDDAAVDRQIQAAKDLETYIDGIKGGPGKGFYRIVYSAAEARQVMQAGKLAVVLGTEVDTEWGCPAVAPACAASLVREQVQRYYDQGIRVVYPVHLVNNAFGGTALYTSVFELNNVLVNGTLPNSFSDGFWNITTECDPALEWRSDLRQTVSALKIVVAVAAAAFLALPVVLPLVSAVAPLLTSLPGIELYTPLLAAVLPGVGALTTLLAPVLTAVAVALVGFVPGEVGAPPQANCNSRGLTAVGQVLIDALMDHRMIIDIDHTDGRTLNAILDRAEERHYPGIVSGHTGLVGASLTMQEAQPYLEPGEAFDFGASGRHEGNKTDETIRRIDNLGGIVSLILHQGGRTKIRNHELNDGIAFDCGDSSQAWAQVYLYATEELGLKSVGIGSDMNGFAGMPAPRNRNADHACGDHRGDIGPNDPVAAQEMVVYNTELRDYYGKALSQYMFGVRIWDYNVDGFAHVGMYPDFIADLQAIGLKDRLAPLFSAGEAYARMWEKVDDVEPPTVACGTVGDDWHAADVSVPCITYDFGWGLAPSSPASFSLSTNVPDGVETDNAATGTHDPICDDVIGHCTPAIPAITGINVDKKDPTVVVTSPSAGLPTYTLNQMVSASYMCNDGGSGIATCAGPVASDSSLDTSLGPHAFTVNAADNVGHKVSVSHPYNVAFALCPLYDATRAYKTGSTIPIKLQLCDATGANKSSPSVALTAVGVTLVSTSAPGILEDAGNANPDAQFRYDSTLGGYVFNLQTKGFATGTYALSFTAVGDPTTHSVQFQVR